ncbi:MAG: hypothetical protein JWP12_1315 [Bacteroidetes bacterium]|nr:hypothetical protein [Bacteroidota bacterium]
MRTRNLVTLLFFISGNFLFSQAPNAANAVKVTGPHLLLKADVRSLELQPKLSLEYFFTKKISLEAGYCYFWTGQKMHFEDFYQQGMVAALFGLGPAKGNDIFSDWKYSFNNGLYLGLGYMYRYSWFTNKHQEADVGENSYQYYNQSETAHSSFVRLTLGGHYKIKNRNLYLNPYISTMIGNTDLQLRIDTTGGKPANYSRDVKPVNTHQQLTRCIVIIGFNFCFDVFDRKKKS